MSIECEINSLLKYGGSINLIDKNDFDYIYNKLNGLFKSGTSSSKEISYDEKEVGEILKYLLDYAIETGLIEDNITERDLLDTKIMGLLTPRPSEVVREFQSRYTVNPIEATNYFYKLAINTNYIRMNRVNKNIKWDTDSKYGLIQMSINMSKPEKDPKEIAKAKDVKTSGYPKCLLCKENVGYAGNYNWPARQNLRLIPTILSNHTYYMQYSPYVYYNEHCIVLNEDHVPMVINKTTFDNLLEFTDWLPHYFIGSNADLPIVGGSILTHDHYQGGHHHFPIEDAPTIREYFSGKYQDIKIEILQWPLSTIRLTGLNRVVIGQCADDILQYWINYNDESVDILSHSGEIRHNTITPIVRRNGEFYEMDLVLRNNRATAKYPDGIFHPHIARHHIKKENIGLIEVMGLSVLPARLTSEMDNVKKYLLNKEDVDLGVHEIWANSIKDKHNYTEDNIDQLIRDEISLVFVEVLEDAGVFKMTNTGLEAFHKFMEGLIHDLNK